MQRAHPLPTHARVVAIAIVSLVALLLLLVLGRLGVWYWQEHQEVVGMEPQVARLLGYRESEAEIRSASEAARASLAGLVYTQDATSVGATVQQQVRRILEEAGLSVLNREVVEGTVHEALEEVLVRVTANGSLEALDQALIELSRARPLLLLDAVKINPVNVRRGEPLQLVNIELAFKAARVL